MKILSMTATFGKLDNETLDLSRGLNVLCAPNEWGKSTWCAFLTAMLYGIDTRERSKADQLADKEKYMPWSGKPMEGTLRVLHKGRDITIQRRTRGRVPMGEFLARETHTGLTVRELTADNCGQELLGVEKSVFLRTGFLRFTDLPVKNDETLRRRLNALVTTGDESGRAEHLGQTLRELKNRCRHNQTGLIPECKGQIRKLQEQLWERQSMQKEYDLLLSRQAAREEELKQLANRRVELDWEDTQADRQRIADARADARTASMLEKALLEKYTDKTDRSEIQSKIRQGEALLGELELAVLEPPGSPIGAAVTAAMAGFLLILAVLKADRGLLMPCIVLAALLLVVCFALIDKRRRAQLWYRIEQTRRAAKKDELIKFLESWRSQLHIHDELDIARSNTVRTRSHLADLLAMARQAPEPSVASGLDLSREELVRAEAQCLAQLDQYRSQAAQLLGRMENLPEPEILERQLAQARNRLAQLEKTQDAIGYAQNALESAMQELQRRFAPRITRRAGEFLSRLTGGVYDRISIDEDLTVLCARDNESTLRTAHWRSEGTGDQMYLALRLAVWEVLAPGCPIILDDALIRFDQERMERALDLLGELGEKRQILLFSCQEREKEYLNK